MEHHLQGKTPITPSGEVNRILKVKSLATFPWGYGIVEVHLVEDGGSRLPDRLARGDIDVALMPAGEDRFSSRLLYPMHVLAVVAQGHRLGRHTVLDVTELVDEP